MLAVAGVAVQPAAPVRRPWTCAYQLQQKYDAIRDFSADFIHSYECGVLKRNREERGTLQVKKPGKMRWEYKGADEEGVRLERRADVSVPARRRTASSKPRRPPRTRIAVLFLAGKGNITRDFNVSFAQGGADGPGRCGSNPRQPQSDYDWLELTADRKTLRMRASPSPRSRAARSTFTFTNFKENPGLADKAFEFSIPRGAEVTNAGPVKR